MKEKSSLINSAMQYGLILGVVFSVNFLMGVSSVPLISLLTFPMFFLILYLIYRLTVRYRDDSCKGTINYGRAFLYILMLFLFAAIISAAVKFVYFKFINPDYLTDLLNTTVETIESMMPAMADEAYDTVERFADPVNFSVLSIWSNLMYGLLAALIGAGIVKRQQNPFLQDEDLTNIS